ncbi:transposase [Halostagnicola bangensis]
MSCSPSWRWEGVPAAEPGRDAHHDYTYKRNGTRNLFVYSEPLVGWQEMTVTDRRTKQDRANAMHALVEQYPDADVIRVVLDNLNTHHPGALYETYPPAEAWRILERLEFYFTPVHGSWLNMAEIEINVLTRQCLDH